MYNKAMRTDSHCAAKASRKMRPADARDRSEFYEPQITMKILFNVVHNIAGSRRHQGFAAHKTRLPADGIHIHDAIENGFADFVKIKLAARQISIDGS